ncbi:beta-ketoacyl reductase, partial [Streptomyces sp. MCAF7]
MPLTGFVVFADFVALTGSDPGSWQAAVDAAYAESLIRHRHARQLPATLLACGPMGSDAGGDAEARLGIRQFDPGRALACLPNVFGGAAGGPGPVVGVADIDWDSYLAHATRLSTGALYRDLPEARGRMAVARTDGPSSRANQAELRAELRELPEEAQTDRFTELVRSQVAQVLGHDDSEQLDGARSFLEIGFSSFTVLE